METEALKDYQTAFAESSREMGAHFAALAIAQMDPHAHEDLLCFIQDLRKAKARKEERAVRYLMDAIRELLVHPTFDEIHDSDGLGDIESRAARNPRWPKVKEQGDARLASFFQRYLHFKGKSGLRTQQQVADSARVSLSTIQAIESRNTRPQYKTIKALAGAFRTSVNELAGDLYRHD